MKDMIDLEEVFPEVFESLRDAMIETVKLFEDSTDMLCALAMMAESVSAAAQSIALAEGVHIAKRDALPTMPPGEA